MIISREFTIQNELGLHARAAFQLVQVANRFDSDVYVSNEGRVVDGKSILGVLMLAAGMGSRIGVKVDGNDAETAIDAIEELVNSKFGEME